MSPVLAVDGGFVPAVMNGSCSRGITVGSKVKVVDAMAS